MSPVATPCSASSERAAATHIAEVRGIADLAARVRYARIMRYLPQLIVPLIAMAACSFTPGAASDGGLKDARLGDGPLAVDGPPPDGAHVLLTEVQAEGAFEFIEIWNPTSVTVDLSTYYLSDYNTYWKLSRHVATSNEITPDTSDFLARFPAGATLAPDAVATIAINEAAFMVEYGTAATYSLVGGASSTAMTAMVTLATPSITNEGEMIVLFQWDGNSDLVKDVDLVVAGKDPLAANSPGMKQAIDGKDVDSSPTSYAPDALTIGDMAADASGSKSYKRVMLEAGHETQGAAGNGITLHDETSENIQLTWDSAATDGTPGVVPFAN